MKRIVFIISIIFVVGFISCSKEESFTVIYIGYIYNIDTKQPFANTQFKFYRRGGLNNKFEEHYFYTDKDGFFKQYFKSKVGVLVWPDYHSGAAYMGPEPFISNRYLQEPEIKTHTSYYDTIYSKERY